jgi:hypothetical protein
VECQRRKLHGAWLGENMKVRLFKLKSSKTNENLYVYSIGTNEDVIRDCLSGQDHGGGSYEDFVENIKNGKLEEITDISQVPQEDWPYTPYNSYELDPNGFSYEIREFLNEII